MHIRFGKTIIAVAAMAALSLTLVACGGGGSGSAASPAAGSSSVPSTVFVMSKAIKYDAGGNALGTTTYERDDRGNTLSTINNNAGSTITNETKNEEHDEYGYTKKLVQPDGQEVTYELTLDGDKLVKSVGSNGGISENAYRPNGTLSEAKSVFSDTFESVITYDENGYVTSRKSVFHGSPENVIEAVYAWEFDSAGLPTSVAVTIEGDSAMMSSGGLAAGKYLVECDAHGNIVKFINADGATISEFEYVEIANPSAACMYNSAIKPAY